MERMSISLNKDVYIFIQKSYKDNPKYRNASHFVEDCIRTVMDGIEKWRSLGLRYTTSEVSFRLFFNFFGILSHLISQFGLYIYFFDQTVDLVEDVRFVLVHCIYSIAVCVQCTTDRGCVIRIFHILLKLYCQVFVWPNDVCQLIYPDDFFFPCFD